MFIKYSDKDTNFIEQNAHLRTVDGQDYFFFPFVLRKVKDGVFEEMDFRVLHPDVKEIVKRLEADKPNSGYNWIMKK